MRAGARRAGLTWPLPEDLSDDALQQRLYPRPTIEDEATTATELGGDPPRTEAAGRHAATALAGVSRGACQRVPRTLVFRCLHRACEKRVSPTMRQTHIAGERMFVDYAGTKLQVIDGITGETLTAELFVAVLGASSLTYAEATCEGLSDNLCKRFP